MEKLHKSDQRILNDPELEQILVLHELWAFKKKVFVL